MAESYVFTGTGFVTGKYEVTNEDIEKYIRSGYLKGFDEERVINSEDYINYKKDNPDVSAFSYMVDYIMGFRKRFHVVPFPPVAHNFPNAQNSLDLVVSAIDKALVDCGLCGNDIDAWFVGTATPHQYSPGIAEFAKSYFTDIDNQKPTYSLTSACVGFNINLSNAISFLKNNKEAKHVVIAHAEVMSKLLHEEKDFVPFSTFGDSASAVILSKTETEKQVGILAIFNGEDTAMLDFLGADSNGNLYMNPRMVKLRAVPNIADTATHLLKQCKWEIKDLKYFIPHQTGNAIVGSVAKLLNIDEKIVYQDVQKNYGNLSGSSIPACISVLNNQSLLIEGDKIITSVAGLGGEFGGFAYLVPKKLPKFKSPKLLAGKTVLITGATGGLGRQVAKIAASEGANLILQYFTNHKLASEIKTELEQKYKVEVSIFGLDLSDSGALCNFVKLIQDKFPSINYLLNLHAITGPLSKASCVTEKEFHDVTDANYTSVKNLCDSLSNIITDCILITGSVGEEAQFAGSASYVASKRALRAYARGLASEIYKNNTRCIYYIPGIIDSGMVSKLEESQIKASMMMVDQKELIPVEKIAKRMLLSVCRLKIPDVRISYESNLKVIKDSYLNF